MAIKHDGITVLVIEMLNMSVNPAESWLVHSFRTRLGMLSDPEAFCGLTLSRIFLTFLLEILGDCSPADRASLVMGVVFVSSKKAKKVRASGGDESVEHSVSFLL